MFFKYARTRNDYNSWCFLLQIWKGLLLTKDSPTIADSVYALVVLQTLGRSNQRCWEIVTSDYWWLYYNMGVVHPKGFQLRATHGVDSSKIGWNAEWGFIFISFTWAQCSRASKISVILALTWIDLKGRRTTLQRTWIPPSKIRRRIGRVHSIAMGLHQIRRKPRW